MQFTLSHARVPLGEVIATARNGGQVSIDEQTRHRVRQSREALEILVSSGQVVYGVNTSVGGFVNWLVPLSAARSLQENLLNAVATNVGRHLDDTAVRAMMLARIVSLSRGHSAISLPNFEKLIAIYNAGIIPCVPEKGSLGTSGDLGPLASIALACIGQWKARYDGHILPGASALRLCGIEPMELSYKEGLALVNGTSGMVGLGGLVAEEARNLIEFYMLVSALSIEGLAGKTKPFDPRVHSLKPHPGQQYVAERLWQLLKYSGLALSEDDPHKLLSSELTDVAHSSQQQIEDAYSIRCTPQILGAIIDSAQQSYKVIEDELNSSNDNPLVVVDEGLAEVFHNGHFHGQYVAMALDHLILALVTLTNLSNRRVDRFLDASNSNGLPAFLCDRDSGVRLGLMGGQFLTASLTAENRTLAVPISVQSLTTTADFQDIVSFGFVAARRAREVLENARYVVAFELLCACQAVDIRGNDGLSSATRNLYETVRHRVPFLDRDICITDMLEELVAEVIIPQTYGPAVRPAGINGENAP